MIHDNFNLLTQAPRVYFITSILPELLSDIPNNLNYDSLAIEESLSGALAHPVASAPTKPNWLISFSAKLVSSFFLSASPGRRVSAS